MRPAILLGCQLFLLGATWAGSGAAACGDGVIDAMGEECDDGNAIADDGCSPDCMVDTCVQLNGATTGHTCFHGRFGPFVATVATPYPGVTPNNVNPSHTYYTVTLSGELNDNRSGIEFTPSVSEPYAIFVKAAYPMVLRTLDGEPVPVRFEHAVDCGNGSLTWARAYGRLDRRTTYVFDIGPWHEPTVSFALEALWGFAESYYADRDDDGFSSKAPAAITACVPSAPLYTQTSKGDCDDNNAATHPGAIEACDGIDSDCDGEDALPRQVCDGATGGAGGAGGADADRGGAGGAASGGTSGGAGTPSDGLGGARPDSDGGASGSGPGGAGAGASAGAGTSDGGSDAGGAGTIGEGGTSGGYSGKPGAGSTSVTMGGRRTSGGAESSGGASPTVGETADPGCGCFLAARTDTSNDSALAILGAMMGLAWARRRRCLS